MERSACCCVKSLPSISTGSDGLPSSQVEAVGVMRAKKSFLLDEFGALFQSRPLVHVYAVVWLPSRSGKLIGAPEPNVLDVTVTLPPSTAAPKSFVGVT
eukprot:417980-Pleurochrysis_carterae.AAC.1